MKTKILSFLFILVMSVGFSSCGKDSGGSSSDAGKTQGAKFRTELTKFDTANPLSVPNVTVAANLINIYAQYDKNKTDAEWKEGFLGGATNFDTSKYDGLSKLLDNGFTVEGIVDVLKVLGIN